MIAGDRLPTRPADRHRPRAAGCWPTAVHHRCLAGAARNRYPATTAARPCSPTLAAPGLRPLARGTSPGGAGRHFRVRISSMLNAALDPLPHPLRQQIKRTYLGAVPVDRIPGERYDEPV